MTPTNTPDEIARSRGYTFRGPDVGVPPKDVRGMPCVCEWSGGIHGNRCPEHGKAGVPIPGDFPTDPPASRLDVKNAMCGAVDEFLARVRKDVMAIPIPGPTDPPATAGASAPADARRTASLKTLFGALTRVPGQGSVSVSVADAEALLRLIEDRDRLATWEAPCPSCRGEAGHESGGVQGWVPGPCTCHPARQEIQRLSADLEAVTKGEIPALTAARDTLQARVAALEGERGGPLDSEMMTLDELLSQLEQAKKIASGGTCVSFVNLCWGSSSLWHQTHRENFRKIDRKPEALSRWVLNNRGSVNDDFPAQVLSILEELATERDTLQARVAAMGVERDHLRNFLSWEPDPSPTGWAWCCWCQVSHPIDQPHVEEGERKARMDWRAMALAEIRGLKAEVERLARGDFTDKSITLLVEQHDRIRERMAVARKQYKELTDQRDALAARLAALAASDDNEPVTPEFMESLGGDSATARDLKRYEICGDAVRVLFHACAGPLCWEPYLAVGKDKRLKNPTRGMVRALAAILADARTPLQPPRATSSGVPLNSSAVASGGVAPATGEEF